MPNKKPSAEKDPRLTLLKQWLSETLTNSFQIKPASSDASFRRYFRITSGKQSFIAMDAPPEHESTTEFIAISQLLRQAKVKAPKIHYQNLEAGFLVLDDFGSVDYLSKLNNKSVKKLYTDALKTLVKMQTINCNDLPKYNNSLLQNEMDLFAEWFIAKHFDIKLTKAQKNTLQTAQQFLIEQALAQPQVFVHRDYHSRNLMVLPKNNPGVIDFQDAVAGPITYDLVSLLRDCYIHWQDEEVYQWVTAYYQMIDCETDLQTFKRWFDFMGLQRHIKVLGIFCRLYYRDGKSNYLNDLPLTWYYTKNICERYPELKAFNKLLDKLAIADKLAA